MHDTVFQMFPMDLSKSEAEPDSTTLLEIDVTHFLESTKKTFSQKNSLRTAKQFYRVQTCIRRLPDVYLPTSRRAAFPVLPDRALVNLHTSYIH